MPFVDLSLYSPKTILKKKTQDSFNHDTFNYDRGYMIVCSCFVYLNRELRSRSHIFHSPMFYFWKVIVFSRPHFELISVILHGHKKHVSEITTFRLHFVRDSIEYLCLSKDLLREIITASFKRNGTKETLY